VVKRHFKAMNIGVVMYQTSFTKGQELVAQMMARELARQGHRAFLITGPYHEGVIVEEYHRLERSVEGFLFYRKSEFQVSLIRVDGYVSTWPPRRITFRDFVSVLRRLSDSFGLDTIISHSTLWNGPEEIAKFVMWKRMLKAQGLDEGEVIYGHMSHYQPPDPMRYGVIERTFRITWNNIVFPQIFRNANVILCTTPIEEDQMVTMGAERKQCHLYPGGVDEEIFKKFKTKDPASFLEKHSIPPNGKLVSYLGTLEERKNPLAVVRIAKMCRSLKDVRFVIAGRPSNQERQIRVEAKDLPNLSYIGTISEEEKVALIRTSYINILMSRMEALGLTQLEFMYGGVPVITSAVGGQRWLVRNGIDGIHVNGPEDLKGAADAIKTLAGNPELRNKLAENARIRSQEFTLSKLTSDMASHLKSLITS
jgi:glycosyltransferase involved in cell wall biosynthesis